ncbi:hypothetical protein [Vibrio bivalvicida]|uniref:DUF1566 domain-containing protein n=1 Tax=Vibrio bivalvicida TaxID=1276888 RepID=A0ABV4MDI0_9VIBR
MKMKITNPQRMKLVAPLMAALLLSACGGDDSESLLSQPGANTLPGVTQPGEGSDGFCTWPDEKGLADCGGEDGNGDGYGDEGDSNQNGYCEPGEYRTRDCDGLYVAPVEDGSIDAEQGSPMVSVEVAPSELTVYKMLTGALSGQSGGESLTVTAPDFATLAGGACGGELNDSDPNNATGECLKIATAEVDGQTLWFTSTPSLAMMEAMGYTAQNASSNEGLSYATTYSETGTNGPSGGEFARFRQDGAGYDSATAEGGQFDRYCQTLADRNFAGKSNWRRPTMTELSGLYTERGNMWDALGWPTNTTYWSSTPDGSVFDGVRLLNGDTSAYGPAINRYASCVSGS